MRSSLAALAALLLAALALAAPAAAQPGPPRPSPHGDVVVGWNRVLLGILRTQGAQPATVQPTRSMAIVQGAIYDAAAAIDRGSPPYLATVHAPHAASDQAAADAAAHTTLVALYPSMQSPLDQIYAETLQSVRAGARRDHGVQVGERVARQWLVARGDDGSNAQPLPYVSSGQPGAYQPTPPSFAAPVFTHWAGVTPFVLRRADQFRPPPPPPVSSPQYAAAINEVQEVGRDSSTSRTADQTQIAKFWPAPIQNYWNEIAQTAALGRGSDLPDTGRLFARLDLAAADDAIAFYDAKYAYALWRPITAIRSDDGNPATTTDPGWTPLNTTPADPSYPGAHSVIAASSARILGAAYGDRFSFDVSSEALPGVTRHFERFSDAAIEAGLSRIYGGVHTRLDHDAGRQLGLDVAGWVLDRVGVPPSRGR